MTPVRLLRHLALFVVYGAIGAALAGFAGLVWLGTSGKPDLEPWHLARLDAEFTRRTTDVRTLDDYRALETRLFEQLRREVYDRVADEERRQLNRYSAGSRADPTARGEDFNRSYVLESPEPRCGVLAVHGLSDSPYVLRAIATKLNAAGCLVVGLRLPGHGTAPAALTTIEWEDWAAAVRLAARDLRGRLGADRPMYFLGFSTGAALSVEYSLARLGGEDLPAVDGLVLVSPAIGVDPLAWLAVWQKRLAGAPGLGKLLWNDLAPEYDPYKYNSFAINAGEQIYRLTQVIGERVSKLAENGPVRGFPRTLVFQSVADATVSPAAVVKVFLGRLAPEGHELVAFDINRQADVEPLLRPGRSARGQRLLEGESWPFGFTLLTNVDAQSVGLVALHRAAGANEVERTSTGAAWPPGVFALSHVALPISPDDPVYGVARPLDGDMVYLGHIELAGEQGMLQVPQSAFGRLRYDPFFDLLVARTTAFLRLDQ